MLCVTLILIAIVSCGGREIPEDIIPEVFNITAVALSSSTPGIDSRIIGGSATTIENFPFTVQILYLRRLACGGSLLTTRHVLSAAHCYVNSSNGAPLPPSAYTIRGGSTYLNQGGTLKTVSTIVLHESYNYLTHDNDVAVLVLGSNFNLSNSVQAGRIPLQGETLADNSSVVAVGWGRISVAVEGVSTVLNEVTVRTVNHTVCRDRYEWLGTLTNAYLPVTDNMLCAGLLDIGGADACQGDSGGPLLYNGVIIGVTSWGYSCAEPLFPGVYAQVSRYTTWINQTVTRYHGNGAPNMHFGVIALLTPLLLLISSY